MVDTTLCKQDYSEQTQSIHVILLLQIHRKQTQNQIIKRY